MLLSFASKASADLIDGAQTFYTVGLYATDYFGYLIPDSTTPSGYAYNELDITVNNTPTLPTEFTLPAVLSDPAGCKWSFDNVPWSLAIENGSNLVTFNGSQVNDFFVAQPNSFHSILLAYNLLGAGTVTMRVTSPGVAGDGSDSTAYTVTVTVVDNSPQSNDKK